MQTLQGNQTTGEQRITGSNNGGSADATIEPRGPGRPPNNINDNGQAIALQQNACLLWLQGNTYAQIGQRLGVGTQYVSRIIKVLRADLAEIHSATIDQYAAEAVEANRLVIATAWQNMNGKNSAKMMHIILKGIETIAKIRGVISDRVHHTGVIVHKKMYDFRDEFPNIDPIPEITEKALSLADMPAIIDTKEFNDRMAEVLPPSKQIGPDEEGIIIDGELVLLEE